MSSSRLTLPVLLLAAVVGRGAELPINDKVDLQPLAAQAIRVADALAILGTPLSAEERKALADAAKDKTGGVAAIQKILDKHCLAGVAVGPVFQAQPGPAKPELAEQGWRVFLIKVYNADGLNKVELRAESPNAAALTRRSSGKPDPVVTPVGEVSKRLPRA